MFIYCMDELLQRLRNCTIMLLNIDVDQPKMGLENDRMTEIFGLPRKRFYYLVFLF